MWTPPPRSFWKNRSHRASGRQRAGSPSPRTPACGAAARRDDPTRLVRRPQRSGFTLAELLIAALITSLLTVALGGLTMAVQTASTYVNGHQDADMQGQITIGRIQYMVSHAGVYRNDSGRTVLGLRVVKRAWADYDLPDVLVVWSGGRQGGLAAQGTLDRLPTADELIVYAPDPADPRRFLEYAFPSTTVPVDFESVTFDAGIFALIESADAEPALLCDQLCVTRLDNGFSRQTVANIRFEAESFPSDDEIASNPAGTAGWYDLRWSQGIVSFDTGLRQTNVRIEQQIETRAEATDAPNLNSTALPYFGSAAKRYVYEP
jgi:hypothetical protein